MLIHCVHVRVRVRVSVRVRARARVRVWMRSKCILSGHELIHTQIYSIHTYTDDHELLPSH